MGEQAAVANLPGDCSLSVAEAIHEALQASVVKDRMEPHLPLRKASAARKRSAPKPLTAPTYQLVRPPMSAPPSIDTTAASNEHAYAGKDERKKSAAIAAMANAQMENNFKKMMQRKKKRGGRRPTTLPVSFPEDAY